PIPARRNPRAARRNNGTLSHPRCRGICPTSSSTPTGPPSASAPRTAGLPGGRVRSRGDRCQRRRSIYRSGWREFPWGRPEGPVADWGFVTPATGGCNAQGFGYPPRPTLPPGPDYDRAQNPVPRQPLCRSARFGGGGERQVATGGPLESAPERRYRYSHRPQRRLVPRGSSHPQGGIETAFFLDSETGGRGLLPGDPGGEVAHRSGRCALLRHRGGAGGPGWAGGAAVRDRHRG